MWDEQWECRCRRSHSLFFFPLSFCLCFVLHLLPLTKFLIVLDMALNFAIYMACGVTYRKTLLKMMGREQHGSQEEETEPSKTELQLLNTEKPPLQRYPTEPAQWYIHKNILYIIFFFISLCYIRPGLSGALKLIMLLY